MLTQTRCLPLEIRPKTTSISCLIDSGVFQPLLSPLFHADVVGTSDDENTITIDGTMAYLMELGANLENAEFLVVMEIVQAPGLGELSRNGFVEGWRATG